MEATRRRGLAALVATLALAAATLALASVPPRPLRSVVTLVGSLGLRVATDWLAVVALLALAERVATGDGSVTRASVRRLTLAVFVGAAAIEASPLARLVVEPDPVATAVLAEGAAEALQSGLFAAGLVAATAAGGAALREALGDDARAGLPMAPSERRLPRVGPRAVVRVARVLGVVAALWLGVELATQLALGVPYFWLAAAAAVVAALGGAVDYGVLAVAFLVLAVDGADARTVVGGTAVVWLVLVVGGIAVAVLSAGLGVALVGATATPMGAVEAAGMGLWPAPDSWTQLLATGAFLAGAAGFWVVQRTVAEYESGARGRDAPVDDSRSAR
ncbi:hypothetical protein [Halosimplex pelagicum]|uniref:Uncharacterized protein n=1 Tax=Halosimplex pelagicum TaxID=869886 RepID=A0A7D5ST64_9EURY|nr:hypothetical protein [Halosimplex pelagicum]QLH80247.1 hypothetical protein HZS54_00790 [Halosimplex pelagicum]